MSAKQLMKAFVRVDGTGRVVPGSLIFRMRQPKEGRWFQIKIDQCCGDPAATSIYALNSTAVSMELEGKALAAASSTIVSVLDALLITVTAATTYTFYNGAGTSVGTGNLAIGSHSVKAAGLDAVRVEFTTTV